MENLAPSETSTPSWLPPGVAESVNRLDLNLDTTTDVPEIPRLLNSTVLSGGKKLRPALLFLMGELFGVPNDTLAPYARLIEWLHCATLAHDDVIDFALMRRKRETLNAVTTNGRAVLAGDLLLARVIVEACHLGNVDILRDLSLALEDLVGGEWLQRDAKGRIPATRASLEEISKKKTGSLMSWCCVVPARLSGASRETIEKARRFGELVGIAFQMTDDLLDFEPDAEKPYAQDLRDGQTNFVTWELVETFPELRGPLELLMSEFSDRFPWTSGQLETAKRLATERAREVLARAGESLDDIASNLAPQPEALRSLHAALAFIGWRLY